MKKIKVFKGRQWVKERGTKANIVAHITYIVGDQWLHSTHVRPVSLGCCRVSTKAMISWLLPTHRPGNVVQTERQVCPERGANVKPQNGSHALYHCTRQTSGFSKWKKRERARNKRTADAFILFALRKKKDVTKNLKEKRGKWKANDSVVDCQYLVTSKHALSSLLPFKRLLSPPQFENTGNMAATKAVKVIALFTLEKKKVWLRRLKSKERKTNGNRLECFYLRHSLENTTK